MVEKVNQDVIGTDDNRIGVSFNSFARRFQSRAVGFGEPSIPRSRGPGGRAGRRGPPPTYLPSVGTGRVLGSTT